MQHFSFRTQPLLQLKPYLEREGEGEGERKWKDTFSHVLSASQVKPTIRIRFVYYAKKLAKRIENI